MTARRLIPALPLLALPGVAEAHMVSTGLGDFYDGLLHPLLSLGQGLPLLGVALWAGAATDRAARAAVLVLPIGWFLGGLIGAEVSHARPWAMAAAICGLLAGLGAAADLRLPRLPAAVAAAAIGLLLGLAAAAVEGNPNWRLSAGMAAAAFFLMLLVAGQRHVLAGRVAPVAARVLASWIAAASLLQLGWLLAGRAA